MRTKCFAILASVTSSVFAATPPATQRNFVACPIVRDTQTVPCWLAEYDGELYYLGIQTDVSAEWNPPYLGHRVLVEGTIAPDTSRICGGVVLQPVVTSVMPELDAACDSQVLPAEDRYTVPFAPRGPGPSNGSLAFGNAPANAEPLAPMAEKQFIVPYEFDWPWVTGKTSRVLQQVVRYAQVSKASRIEITGYRGAVLLSNGEKMVEQRDIAERRAKQVAELLTAVGIDSSKLKIEWRDGIEPADGTKDFDQRRVTVLVKTSP